MSSSSSHKSINSTHDELPIQKIQTTGDNHEFIIINNKKYYKSDLQQAFGGTLIAGPTPYPTININSAPVGLSAFALTTFVLSLYNAKAFNIEIPNVVVSVAIFYGGLVQLLAGLLEFLSNNTFGFTALTSYGAFWLAFGAIYIDNFGIADAYKDDPDQMANAVGFFLLGWAIFTFMILLVTLKTTVAFFSLFFFLLITFLLLAGGEFSGRVGVTRAGGVFGMITAVISWYNAMAGTATKYNSYIRLKPIPLPGNAIYKGI
ncbi:uncharacterized protein KGF55_005285 [Candida pseudojiufengensis]|uniref:uncharacterized protein n=1 Tax=Candida pseudojiufengensis TaxID=497109 RepID=UPI0022240267|nr:uncharacterized protein KGF55_005285 [Candida pseudojiufengensis]KAI5959641.1 hypothetical protein KGF55_005285 [Candida pseudojiufengensis]